MICLTGDIHHDSLHTNEQLFAKRHLGVSEVKICADYLHLFESRGLKCTLYVTGKTLAEQWDDFYEISASKLIEIGGHTYRGLPRSAFSKLKTLATGGVPVSHARTPGSFYRQQTDTEKMAAIALKRTGKPLRSWRSHGLVRDGNTNDILAAAGIRFVSDELNWQKIFPETTPEGLVSHPINVLMDHDHIYHAHRTREYVARQSRTGSLYHDDPTAESYDIKPWADIVIRQTLDIDRQGGVATLILHPLCMYVADRFQTLELLLNTFSRCETIWACETARDANTRKESL